MLQYQHPDSETDTFQTVKSPSTEVKKVQIQVTNFPIPLLLQMSGTTCFGGLSYCSTTKDHYLNNADILTYICVFRNDSIAFSKFSRKL